MTAMLLNHLWQSSLFALGVGALTLLFLNNGASVRHGLWLVASIKFLLPFYFLAYLGRHAFTHTVTARAMQTLTRVTPAAMPFAAMPASAHSQAPPWALIATAAWGLGIVIIALIWLARGARLWRIVRAARPLALPAPVPVRVTSELLEPGLAGIFRPIILLPESLTQMLSGSEIDAILAHEVCHLRRRDNLAATVHMLVETLFWFHPLVWYIGARLVEAREEACDQGVLEDGKQPLDYAAAILKVCRLYFRSSLPCASGVSGADLERRITAIMARRDNDDIDPHKILLLAGLGAIVVMTPMAVGGLKQATPMPLARDLVQRLVTAQRPMAPVMPAPSRPRHAIHAFRVAKLAPPEEKLVAAPDIDAGAALIILPAPELAAAEAAIPEAPICRPPQHLPTSHLMGPQVCLPKSAWDAMAAKGLQLMPDGKTLAPGYEKEHSLEARSCRMTPANSAAAAQTLNFTCF